MTVVKRIASIVFGLIFALLVAEIALRVQVARGDWPDRTPIDIFAPHPIGWALEPGLANKVYATNGIIDIHANSLGFRDREYQVSKSEDKTRMLVLGDSFVLALETPQQDTFHVRLEDRYDESVEVISLGVSGYGLTQEFLVYQHVGRDFDPDVVLLTFYTGNDLVGNRNWPNIPHYSLSNEGNLTLLDFPYGGQARLPVFLDMQPSTPLMRMSRVAFVVGLASRQSRQDVEDNPNLCPYHTSVNYPDPSEDDWAFVEAMLIAIRDQLEQDGTLLKVVIIPTEIEVEDSFVEEFLADCREPDWADNAQHRARLTALLQDNDISYLNLTPILRNTSQTTGTLMYIPGSDIHWTSAGHSTVANALYKWLELE